MNKDIEQHGFTLIEMMAIMMIIVILTAIVFPIYRQHVLKSYRTLAYGAVMSVATELEQVRLQRFSYASLNGQQRQAQRYRISITSSTDQYLIQATPIGEQALDKCGSFSFDESGHWRFQNGSSKSECS